MKDFIHAISACKAPILRLSILLQFVLFFYEGALQAQAPQILKDINGYKQLAGEYRLCLPGL